MVDEQQAVPVAQINWRDPIGILPLGGGPLVPAIVVAGPDKDGDYRVSFRDRSPNSWVSGLHWFHADGTPCGATGHRVLQARHRLPHPCKSGEGAGAIADAVASALAKYAVAYTHVTLTDMSTAGRSWKVHETGHGNPFEHGVWLGEFDTKEAANAFCADLRRSAAIEAARAALNARGGA